MKVCIPIASLFIFSASNALAADGILSPEGKSKMVHVWVDERAHKSAHSLFAIGIPMENPEVITNLAACSVVSGTRASVDETDDAVIKVRVIDGTEAGCTGVVSRAQFKAE